MIIPLQIDNKPLALLYFYLVPMISLSQLSL